jgi:hypothetical protein
MKLTGRVIYSEVILTNFFAEPTVLLVPITSRVIDVKKVTSAYKGNERCTIQA